jgi:hypothetical protein
MASAYQASFAKGEGVVTGKAERPPFGGRQQSPTSDK